MSRHKSKFFGRPAKEDDSKPQSTTSQTKSVDPDKKTELEIQIKELYDSPHRQTNEWNSELDTVLRKYLKLNNPRMFEHL